MYHQKPSVYQQRYVYCHLKSTAKQPSICIYQTAWCYNPEYSNLPRKEPLRYTKSVEFEYLNKC